MATKRGRGEEPPELERLIEEIVVDTYDDDEQLWAFRQAFEDSVILPAEAFLVGEPVTVMEIDYDGNERRGLTARCRGEGGSEQVIAACDLFFAEGSTAARYLAAYRKWLGIEPHPQGSLSKTRRRPQKATEDDIDMSRDVELIAIAVKGNAVSCRLPGKDRVITIRTTRLWDLAPGEIINVTPRKQWRYKDHPYLSGEIKTWRLDIPALGRKETGDSLGAHRMLMSLLAADLRCLDAHAHLGNFAFDHSPEKAIRHYEVGVRIGNLSLGEGFNSVLHWGHIHNRPFLRCMHGYGLCLSRLGRHNEAEEVFTRMFWLNPSDNQGVRFLLGEVREGKVWHE